MRTCPDHTYRVAACASCHAANTSVALRVIQDDLDECRRAFNFDELIRHVEAHMRGEVE